MGVDRFLVRWMPAVALLFAQSAADDSPASDIAAGKLATCSSEHANHPSSHANDGDPI